MQGSVSNQQSRDVYLQPFVRQEYDEVAVQRALKQGTARALRTGELVMGGEVLNLVQRMSHRAQFCIEVKYKDSRRTLKDDLTFAYRG
jgi:hypothetical protein